MPRQSAYYGGSKLVSDLQVQAEQEQRHREWILREGEHYEWPVQDSTYERPHEQARLAWHVLNTKDVPNYQSSEHKSIAEFGCSTGRILTECNGLIGLDLSPDIIAENIHRYPGWLWAVEDATEDFTKHWWRNVHTVLLPGFLEHLTFDQALDVVRKAKQLATNRILITVPNGTDPLKNVQDYSNFKHQWICSEIRLRELLAVCRDGSEWEVTNTQDDNTIFVRMDKK